MIRGRRCAPQEACGAPFVREDHPLRLNPPTVIVFFISLIFALGAIVTKGGFFPVPRYLPHQEYWLAITAYMVLVVGNVFRGL